MAATVFINDSNAIGLLFNMFTNNVTGSPFITLLAIFMLLMVLSIGANIPLEWTAIFMLPLAIYLMAYTSEFLQIGGFILVYLGILLAKTWFGSER